MNKTAAEQRFLNLLYELKQQDFPNYLAQVAILSCAVEEQPSDSEICSYFENANSQDLNQAISRIKECPPVCWDIGIRDKASACIRRYQKIKRV